MRERSRAIVCAALGVLAGATACTTKQVCTPGETRACLGPGQCAGAQFCTESGAGFSACDCGTTGGGGGSDAGAGGGGAGGGSATGGGGGDAGVVRGAAQKGPFIVGATVSIAALDQTGAQTGQVFMSQIRNDLGEFELTVPTLPQFAELEASGFHFNEVTGALSGAELTLRSIAALDGTPTYINVITHLAANRTRALASSGGDLTAAQTTAEQELRAALPIGAPSGGAVPASLLNLLGGDTDSNAYLFAVSVVFAQAAVTANPNAVDAELQQLLNTAALDFADGTFEPALIARLEAAERVIDVERVHASFRRRLLAIGSTAVVPDLNRVMDSDGDGIVNVADGCPLQAGAVPSTQFCIRDLALLELDVGEVAVTSRAIAFTRDAGSSNSVALQWLGTDGGLGPLMPIADVDGGALTTAHSLVVNDARDGSGEVIVGLLNAGCATAAFASPAGVTRVVRFACDATEAPSVFQAPSGAMYALWRSNTPPFHSSWFAWSAGGSFGQASLLCTECLPYVVASSRGAVAMSWVDLSVPAGGQLLTRSDGDGGWTVASVPPFDGTPRMTVDVGGRLRAVWTGGPGPTTFDLKWSEHDGSMWSATGPVASMVEPWPVMASNDDGASIVAFSTMNQLVGRALAADGGSWDAPQMLTGGLVYPSQALFKERTAAVFWSTSGSSSSAVRFDTVAGWGAAQVLPRVAGEPLGSFVDASTIRIVWRRPGGGLSTAVLR